MWTTYQVLPQLRLGGGVTFRSSQTPNRNPPGIVAPSFVTGDLMAQYDFSDAVALMFNVTNVTNHYYADSLYSGHYVPGAPRTVPATADGALLSLHAMLLHIKQVLDRDELRAARAILDRASWGDGRVTAGVQSALAKNNQQLDQQGEASKALQPIVLQGLNRHMGFFSAALPKRVFRRCSTAMAARPTPSATTSTTRCASSPAPWASACAPTSAARCSWPTRDEYDGGELVVEDTFGAHSVKLPAGDLVLYPGTSVHRVEPVTRGHPIASFFWVESMVRSDEQRRLLYDMDRHLMRLRSTVGEYEPAVIDADRPVPQPAARLGRRVKGTAR